MGKEERTGEGGGGKGERGKEGKGNGGTDRNEITRVVP